MGWKDFYTTYFPFTVGRFLILALVFYLGVSLAYSFSYGPAEAAKTGLPLWFYDLFILKTAGITSAHTTTYFTIFAVYVISWVLTDSEYLAFLTAGAYAAIHEISWFMPYFVFYWSTLPFNQRVADSGFVIGLLGALYFYLRRYTSIDMKLAVMGTFLATLLFDVMWVLAGFHITVNGAVPTHWVNDIATSLWEDSGWYLEAAIFIPSLLLLRNQIRSYRMKYGWRVNL
jgi:hypothetical protein